MSFEDGEEMPMHEFLERFKRDYCGGVEPRFYQSTVRIYSNNSKDEDGAVNVTIFPKEKI